MKPILKMAIVVLPLLPTTSVYARDAGWIVDKPAFDIPAELIVIADNICQSALQNPRVPVMELQSILDTESRAIHVALQDPQTLDQAVARAAALRDRLGPLERLPSVELQFVLAMLAERTHDDAALHLYRATGQVLLARMEVRGLGQSSEEALRPCLIENEYSWLQIRANFSKHHSQRVETEDGRAFDVLEIDDAQGQRRTVYFDVTPLFEAYDRAPGNRGN
ncbi:MAG: hypothetical protein LBL59_06435 [Xanthomonadaceae bacterium]|nr:hypothetical protein [Xanthomonadaceae bacterium]